MSRRGICAAAAGLALLVVAAVAATLLSTGAVSTAQRSNNTLAFRPSLPAASIRGHIADLLLRSGREAGKGGDPDAGPLNDPAVEAYANEAYPASSIAVAQTLGAQHA